MRREVKLPPEAVAALKRQLQKFRDKFGREPGPDDLIFFDPDEDTPTAMTVERFDALFRAACKKAGVPEAAVERFLAITK